MRECAKICSEKKKKCNQQDCRLWIDYKKDLNCTLIAVKGNPSMTLEEVSKRLGISLVRVKQIQDKAVQKMQKNSLLKAF